MLLVYRKNHGLAKEQLKEGIPVTVADTCSREVYHEMVRDLVAKLCIQFVDFLFQLTDEEELLRLKCRKNKSNSKITAIE